MTSIADQSQSSFLLSLDLASGSFSTLLSISNYQGIRADPNSKPSQISARSLLFSISRFFFFCCGSFLKSLLNLLQYCFCFMFRLFGHKTYRILGPRPGIEPAPLHWKTKSQSLDSQGSPSVLFKASLLYIFFNRENNSGVKNILSSMNMSLSYILCALRDPVH